jgi:predicted O-methyltransferase YrrM
MATRRAARWFVVIWAYALLGVSPAAPLSSGLDGVVSRRGFALTSAAYASMLRAQKAHAAGATQYSTVDDLLAYVRTYAKQGDADSVIAAIDSFSSPENENKIDGWGRWMMNVGPAKGDLLEALVRDRRPNSYLEVGTFCGYSALRTLRALPEGATFVTIEKDPRTAAVAKAMFEFAGVLDSRIDMVVGSSAERFGEIRRRYKGEPFEFVLFDHWSVRAVMAEASGRDASADGRRAFARWALLACAGGKMPPLNLALWTALTRAPVSLLCWPTVAGSRSTRPT